LRQEIVHKIITQQIGDRGIEFEGRDHSQVDGSRDPDSGRIYLGGIVFTSEIVPKNSVQERP